MHSNYANMSHYLTVVVSLGLAIAPPVTAAAIAQTPPPTAPHAPLLAQAAEPSSTVLWVDPTRGNDDTADGSDRAPFQTITKALAVAPVNTTIQLVPGTYSAATGETFPLQLKSGVTVQGNSQTRGQNILIQGSGYYLSRTFARQKVTILGANRAALMGVTVTNPEPAGYGLWVESTSPTVVANTFTGSTHDGISIVGDSAPLIQNNYFYENGANGMTIYGTSRPEVRDNVFERTGFGININQKAAPLIVNNRITQNKDGVVVQAKAQPILRQNSVEGNERDGLVTIASSRPNLGTATDPGNNFFRNNGNLDVNAEKTDQSIPVFGNELLKTVGNLDFAGTDTTAATAAIAPAPSQPPASSPTATANSNPSAISAAEPQPAPPRALAAAPRPSTQAVANRFTALQPSSATPTTADNGFPIPAILAPRVPTTPLQTPPALLIEPAPTSYRSGAIAPPSAIAPATAPPPMASAPARPRPMQVVAHPAQPVVATAPPPTPTSIPAEAIEIPVPPPQTPNRSAPEVVSAVRPPLARGPVTPPPMANAASAIEIPVPPPERPAPAPVSQLVSNRSDIPRPSAGLAPLPVPSGDIPVGNVGDVASVYRQGSGSDRVTSASDVVVRYRVVVLMDNDSIQAQVKTLVPGAFPVAYQGRTVMQVGAFGDRAKADQLVQILVSQGLQASVEPMN